jgi:predicted RNase H-like HicB family nuclease
MASQAPGIRYTVVIQWSEEDEAYVVSLPEWQPSTYCGVSGATYEEAAAKAQDLLKYLVEMHDPATEGPLPTPKLFSYPGADVVNLPEPRSAGRNSPAVA